MHHGEFKRVFAAAHRVWNDPGKCSNIHGHNYEAVIDVMTDRLNAQNFVIPFDAIKETVDAFDHTLILDEDDPMLGLFVGSGLAVSAVPGVPSTEFMAKLLTERILATFDSDVDVTVSVDLRETAGISASYGAAR